EQSHLPDRAVACAALGTPRRSPGTGFRRRSPRMVGGRNQRSVSVDRCTIIVRRDQARGRTADRGIPRDVWNARGREPLRGRCLELTGRTMQIGSEPETRFAAIPYYVSGCGRLFRTVRWRPQRGIDTILDDIHRWLLADRARLEPILGQ